MILKKMEFLHRSELDQETLEVWVGQEWLLPAGTSTEPAFSEADLARALLIRDLIFTMGVNDEGIGIILHLVDQMHGLRRVVADLVPVLRNVSRSTDSGASIDQDQGQQ